MDIDDRDYVALVAPDENDEIYLFGCIILPSGELILRNIENEMEYSKVQQHFWELLNDDNIIKLFEDPNLARINL